MDACLPACRWNRTCRIAGGSFLRRSSGEAKESPCKQPTANMEKAQSPNPTDRHVFSPFLLSVHGVACGFFPSCFFVPGTSSAAFRSITWSFPGVCRRDTCCVTTYGVKLLVGSISTVVSYRLFLGTVPEDGGSLSAWRPSCTDHNTLVVVVLPSGM